MFKIIAHRGLHNKIIKENTYLSIINAFNNPNIKGIEIDIRLTKDHQLVIIHDKLINRTSNGTGIVENMTYQELYQYNYGNNFNYQTIPILDKVIKLNKNNKIIVLEIKVSNNINQLINALTKYLNQDNLYIMSLNKYLIKKLYSLYHPNNISRLSFLKNQINYKYQFNAIPVNILNNQIINKSIKKNKLLFIWNIKKKSSLKKISNQDYLYLITDHYQNFL